MKQNLILHAHQMAQQTERKRAPFGTWVSPITAGSITKNANSIEDILVDSVTNTIYHLERRPSEKGRSVLVETVSGKDVVGPEWNVRTGAQEYGGGAAIVHNGHGYFSNFSDGRIYRVDLKGDKPATPEPLTPADKPHRYANFALHPSKSEYLVAVLEDHTDENPSEAKTSLVVVNTSAQTISPLVSGADFYALPRFSPDGSRIVWQQWFHPDMPWLGGQIYVAETSFSSDNLTIANPKHIAGVKEKISASYPAWATNTTLIYTSDVSGFVNPWKYDVATETPSSLLDKPLDYDFAPPFWSLGEFPYAVVSEGKGVVFVAIEDGRDVIYYVSLVSSGPSVTRIASPYVSVGAPRSLTQGEIVFAGQKGDTKKQIVKTSVSSLINQRAEFEVIKPPSAESSGPAEPELSPDLVSLPRPITLELPDNKGPLYVVYYAPHNPQYEGSSIEGESPPCVVSIHGGPTGYVGQGLDWRKQYFTSRGWGWLDVNYSGSSGYGRAYIERLDGNWGISDVQDSIHAARSLSSAPYNLIDPKRITIRGGSAGGFTVLAAISTAPTESDLTVFAAAQSSYGISDLEKLEEFTHKFESKYLDKLIFGAEGGRTKEERDVVYQARSPIFHVDRIKTPLLILQGSIDKVVPKEQAELIYDSIKAKGGLVEYKLYDGEGHGWRKEENLRDSLDRELDFYGRVLGITRAA
ncbi:alpha/beta-hydrolase [Coprinopsis marcescibilis]|uniref:Alpha/beta-hydrolase n=1 Tax=Coprinopsis marcescibilis TaxID=230819 RepID=A0A5C3KRW2_COPMA|nr:alpha/beta-hydrolase [Coprinopsis marcescibilis]